MGNTESWVSLIIVEAINAVGLVTTWGTVHHYFTYLTGVFTMLALLIGIDAVIAYVTVKELDIQVSRLFKYTALIMGVATIITELVYYIDLPDEASLLFTGLFMILILSTEIYLFLIA